MSTAPLLIELGTEELPPATLKPLGETLLQAVRDELSEQGIEYGAGRWFATPRRLAVLIEDVARRQPDSVKERLGPALSAAFDNDGNATGAATGFARSCGVAPEQLETAQTPKGERLAYRESIPGRDTAVLLPELLGSALARLPVAKRMRWADRREEFVRPLQWLLLLHGEDVVRAELFGVPSGTQTRGHRVHCKQALTISSPSEYERVLLEQGHVIADFAARRVRIAQQVQEEAARLGARAVLDDALLDEVTGLVEWPVALSGHFDAGFLNVPSEALISSMKSHQKYFHLLDEDGALAPHFVFVANLDSADPAQVCAGNERVIRPRLADAAFFYDTDCRLSLEARRERLRSIVFQQRLGSLWDKTERIARLAESCAERIGAEPEHCRRAGELAKSDLVSEMVLEFDELQGTMGRYYACNDGESDTVACAIEEQYLPRHAGDRLPATSTGICLALCDRLDTLTGLFGIGQPPTGSKDPFGLRRAALGVLRILIEHKLDLDLRALLECAAAGHTALENSGSVVDEVLAYVIERLRAWYQEEGIPSEVFHAVAARDISRPVDFDRRVHAVAQFSRLPEAESLASANKRVANILAKRAQQEIARLDRTALVEDAEIALGEEVAAQQLAQKPLLDSARYGEALQSLATLRAPVDRFFDEVLVNCEDEAVRRNRMALLEELRALFLGIADISELAGAL